MSNEGKFKNIADIPLAKPGFNALSMSAPVLMQISQDGKWETCPPPAKDDEETAKLRAVVQHLIHSKAVSTAQSYCCQCAFDHQVKDSNKLDYVPVIMMPLYAADECPFDMECEIRKIKPTTPKKASVKSVNQKNPEKEKAKQKHKKHSFVLQRLTDFDLLSQW